jgi:ribosome recycling factor
MVKILHQKKRNQVMLRNIRAESRKEIEKQEVCPGLAKMIYKTEIEDLDQAVRDYIAKLEDMVSAKNKSF